MARLALRIDLALHMYLFCFMLNEIEASERPNSISSLDGIYEYEDDLAASSQQLFLEFNPDDLPYGPSFRLVRAESPDDNLLDFDLQVTRAFSRHLYRGDEKAAIALLEYFDDIDVILTPTRQSAIHLAVVFGQAGLLASIVDEHGANVNAQDENGDTPLHLAVKLQNMEIVDFLCDRNSYLNLSDKSGEPPLALAIGSDSMAIFLRIVDAGADPRFRFGLMNGNTMVHLLLWRGKFEWLEALKGDLTDLGWDTRNDDGVTPLMLAAVSGNESAVRHVLKYSPNAHASDNDGNTALHYAAGVCDASEAIRTLLSKPTAADPNLLNFQKKTPLMLAVSARCYENVDVLLLFGSKMLVRGQHAASPLHLAIRAGSRAIVDLILLHSPLSVYLRDHAGMTPLHRAVERRNHELTRVLILRDSDILAEDSLYRTTLSLARESGDHALISLVEKGLHARIQTIPDIDSV